ncbi:MAG: hypothetical protein CSA33_03435 [Desulfobulbus propionicus]|nr:MAG: hypothetical protein CSA33_03435 [Desulfobulbus propionicus]
MQLNFIILLIIFASLAGCRSENPSAQGPQPIVATALPPPEVDPGCRGCHQEVVLDDWHHTLLCTQCHKGENHTNEKDIAHQGLRTQPAHPDHMQQTCGECHPKQVTGALDSLHFTLKNKINQVRYHFGATTALTGLLEVPQAQTLGTPLELCDDLLRKRCLRCHPYSAGDSYSLVHHGTGCASCHLTFENQKLQSHVFRKPTVQNCTSCHYGNYVGSDYQGRFENDFNWEYRTPYITQNTHGRLYGIEYLNLSSDIHQQRSLTCTDCHYHTGHGPATTVQCRDCHQWQPGTSLPPLQGLRAENDQLVLLSAAGNKHPIPTLHHPAHEHYGGQVTCQVCHAQWVFNDAPVYLLRSTSENWDMWERLTVQGSSEIETLLEHNLFSDEEELENNMRDGITGKATPGVWFKGYGQRRWENMHIARDTDGMIKIFRPILDLRLSMVNDEEQVLFDNITGTGSVYKPYTPHTTGPAGLFFRTRFEHLLEADMSSIPGHKQP